MATRKTKKKGESLNELKERVRDLGGFTEVSKEDVMREYARINRMVSETGDKLEREGILVEREVGTVNNRHMAQVENEALGPYKKLVDMLTNTTKVMEALKKSPVVADEDDEFDEFLTR